MKGIRAAGLALGLAVVQVALFAAAAQAYGLGPASEEPVVPCPDRPGATPCAAPPGERFQSAGPLTGVGPNPPASLLAANGTNATPAATITVEQVAGRLSGTRVLPAYSVLAFRIEAAEGDSILFQADASQGSAEVFDSYLFNAENYTVYAALREGGDPYANVSFFIGYTRLLTEHTAFTTDPLPAGTYFVVIDNDERLSSGANPNGTVTVTFAIALVNNSLPPTALIVILAGAAAAIYATIRWRPVFDARSPLLDMDGEGESDEEGADEAAHPDMDEGEGPPPHPR